MANEFFITVHGWMLRELHLQGNELLLFAAIYGRTQEHSAQISIAGLASWLDLNCRTIERLIETLKSKDVLLVEKQKKRTVYRALRRPLQQELFTDKVSDKVSDKLSDKVSLSLHPLNRDEKEINNKEKKKKEIFKESASEAKAHTDTIEQEHVPTPEERRKAAEARERFFCRMGALTADLTAGNREARKQRRVRDELAHAPRPVKSPEQLAADELRQAFCKGAAAADTFDFDTFRASAEQIYATRPALLQECLRGYKSRAEK